MYIYIVEVSSELNKRRLRHKIFHLVETMKELFEKNPLFCENLIVVVVLWKINFSRLENEKNYIFS